MSGGGCFEIQNDENVDIYKDIGDFHFDKELTKLEESNKAYSKDIERLSEKIKHLSEKNTELENINNILVTNISILLKTAKAEIQRKQLVIDEFRKKIECTNKRNGFKEGDEFTKMGTCKNCGTIWSKAKGSDLEDGEILGHNSEEDDVKSSGSYRISNDRGKRHHSGNHKKRRRSRDRSRGRSNDKYSSHSHRSSRRSDEVYSRHCRSSKSRPRYKSPDERRYSSRRKRSKEKRCSPDYVRSSSSHRKEYSPYEKEVSRRSEERKRSHRSKSSKKENSPQHKSGAKNEKKLPENVESLSRPASACENKTSALKSDCNFLKNWTEEKENERVEGCNKGKNGGVTKLDIEEYHERKNSGNSNNSNNGNGVINGCETNLFTSQSVLADLYDETIFCSRFSDSHKPKNPEAPSDCVAAIANCADSSSDESWSLSFGKKPEPVKKQKTLYSRRMEARLKQKLKEEELASVLSNESSYAGKINEDEEKCSGVSCAQIEKEEGEITLEEEKETLGAEDIAHEDEIGEKIEEAPTVDKDSPARENVTDGAACGATSSESEKPQQSITDKDSEQSFGENIIKKMLQLRKEDENSEIKEFSPLKNNYKLSEISPVKPVSKQHILDYYNLKPAQQLNNIDPEVLDFPFSVPETPGKNFLNPFGALDGQESVREEEKTFDEEKNVENLVNNREDEGKKDSESNRDELKETDECSKFEKDVKVASPEIKAPGRTRAQKRLSELQGKSTNSKKAVPKSKVNKDTVTYQIRTRSRTGSENKKLANETNNANEKKRGKVLSKSKSVPGKRKREIVSSEEKTESGEGKKRKRAKSGVESEKSQSNTGEQIEAGNLDGSEIDASYKAGDITYFEVFQSVSGAANDAIIEDKTTLEELSLSNMSDYRATNTSCSDTPNKLKHLNESKISLLSAGNSGDSSTFKVLKSYLMLSANEDSEMEVFSDDSSCNSGEYSDSGASAFVDLL